MAITTIQKKVDLTKGTLKQSLGITFVTGNSLAHTLEASLWEGDTPFPLTGYTGKGLCKLSNGTTVIMAGQVTQNLLRVTLPSACYSHCGRTELHLQLIKENTVITVLILYTDIVQGETDSLIDPGNIVPSMSELLAQVAVIQSAANRANVASELVEGLTVTGETVAHGEGSSAKLTTVDGHYHMALRLEQGERGVPGEGDLSTTDIVDNLTTPNASKLLSANQGVVLKGLVDSVHANVSALGNMANLRYQTGSTGTIEASTGNTTSTTVTFATPFDATPLFVGIESNTALPKGTSLSISSISATGFKVNFGNVDSITRSTNVKYFAVGG